MLPEFEYSMHSNGDHNIEWWRAAYEATNNDQQSQQRPPILVPPIASTNVGQHSLPHLPSSCFIKLNHDINFSQRIIMIGKKLNTLEWLEQLATIRFIHWGSVICMRIVGLVLKALSPKLGVVLNDHHLNGHALFCIRTRDRISLQVILERLR